MRPLVLGNWKMNGDLASASALSRQLAEAVGAPGGAEVGVLPPAVHVSTVAQTLNGSEIRLGAQNVADAEQGAYTGEISALMLREFGCSYALVGHSERREHYDESDELVAARHETARAAGVTPVLCVGETLGEREAGHTEAVIARQLDAVTRLAGVQALVGGVVAYEPVWAIGTGHTATPEQVQAVHGFIRSHLAADGLRIIYGGSVKPDNAAALLSLSDVDGGLIGGASLQAEGFISICQAAGY